MKVFVQTSILGFALATGFTAFECFADGAVKEVIEDVKTTTQKGVDVVKDAACPLVDGKVKCAAKKAKRKVKAAAEDLKK